MVNKPLEADDLDIEDISLIGGKTQCSNFSAPQPVA